MSDLLLATKLHCPSISSKRVLRSHLVRRLNEGLKSGRQMTLISAPAGFGKSTCAAEWISGLDRPAAWLSLDRSDDDPIRFFTYLVAALQQVDEELGGEIEGIIRSGQLPPIEIISTMLINDVLHFKGEFLLVLDDFQVLQEPAILEAVERLVANQPGNMHLVLLTREDPSLPLARLRANNQLTEIRAADLRFVADEAVYFLNEVMSLHLSTMDIAVLEDKTEGWIAGLQLAGLSIRDRVDPSSFIATLSGSHRHILSYLTEEVLRGQPEDVQQFLLQTSILDRLNGDLCNAVTGRADSHLLLERLLVANLFLIPLDDEQQWYRYHHLFADLLRNLQNGLQQHQTKAIHQRASRWYAEGGMANEAVQHALAASDYELVVHLIEKHAVELLIQGYAKTLQGCLQALPPEWALHSPKANLAFGWMHLIPRNYSQVVPFVERLHAIFASSPIEDASLQSQWLALQSFMLIGHGSPAESLRLASEALRIAPAGDGYVQGLAYHALATACVVAGDHARGMETYQKAILHSRAGGNFAAEMLATAALVQMALQHGQLHFAFDMATRGLDRVEREGVLSPICAVLYSALAQVSYLWCQLDQARPYQLRAMQLSPLSAYSDTEIGCQIIQSRVLQAAGDLKASAAAIDRAVELMRIVPPVWVREEVVAQQVRVYLAQDRLAEAEIALQEQGFSLEGTCQLPDLVFDQPIPPPVGLLYNSALHILLHHAQASQELVNLNAGLDLANRLIDDALQGEYLPMALETLLIRAQMYAFLGDTAASLDDVARALELAEPEGFISVFVEEGPTIAGLLTELLKGRQNRHVQPGYIQQIFTVFFGEGRHTLESPASDFATGCSGGLIEPLSSRELEIIRLIAEGCSNQQIAERLVLSLHTVKKHISNIFGKLGVNSRTQAIALARRSKLL